MTGECLRPCASSASSFCAAACRTRSPLCTKSWATKGIRIRLKAAQVIINYAHPVQTAHHVTVEHVDDRRMVDFALKLAAEMGVEAGKLVGRIDGKLIEQEP